MMRETTTVSQMFHPPTVYAPMPLSQKSEAQGTVRPVNSCGRCGATSYRLVIERQSDGVMRPSGRSRYGGCKREFSTLGEWRDADRAVWQVSGQDTVIPGRDITSPT